MSRLNTSTSLHREVAALAGPIVLTQLAQVALTTTDTVMMGGLGTAELAGGGLAIVLFNQVRTMGVGLITATGNQVAAAVGRHETDQDPTASPGGDPASSPGVGYLSPGGENEVRGLVRASFLLATAAGVLGVALLVALGFALPLMGQSPAVAANARPMVIALAPGLLPCLWFQAIRQYTVGMRRPKQLLVITVASVALNIVLNLALLKGLFGLPRLGLPGIGVSTSIGYLVTFTVFWVVVQRDRHLSPMLSARIDAAPGPAVGRLFRLGVPISLTYGSEAGLFTLVALFMGGFGAAALAAHNLVNQAVYIVFQVAIGLSHGASVLVSRYRARAEYGRVRRIATTALTQAAVVVSAVGVLYVVAPGLVVWAFARRADAATAAVAGQLLMIAAVSQFFDAAQNLGVGLLRGLDDTAAGFRLSLVGYWLVGLPTALALAYAAGWGPVGVWVGLAVGLAVTAGSMWRRFLAGTAQA